MPKYLKLDITLSVSIKHNVALHEYCCITTKVQSMLAFDGDIIFTYFREYHGITIMSKKQSNTMVRIWLVQVISIHMAIL